MVYNIFTFIIVGFAFFIAGRKVYFSFKPKKNTACSTGCAGCGTPCNLKDIVINSKASH
ncbi:MAG: FeoB-associated Cys-rich membrane protein [Salinivirgaceae bacterium]|nr:FeoB-associated Cys-rich membrane protein [Salinivirgaceae bacterium]